MTMPGKTHGQNRPTALGTMLNASTYGQTIPSIHGMTRSTFLAIWAANIRKGASSKKAKKKGVTTYVENVDFLIGSNPIEGVCQIFANNSNRYTLDLISVRFSLSGGTPHHIIDPDLYFIIGATAEVTLNGVFNDYGCPSNRFAFSGHLVVGGSSGYTVGDTFSLNGSTTSDPATATVLSIDVFNRPSAIRWDTYGSGYVTSITAYTTTTLTGGGAGVQFVISELGTAGYEDIYEFPLWNCAQHGPDLIQAGCSRWWPYVFKWAPSDGAFVYFPAWWNILNYGFPNGNGYVNVYYAKLNTSTKKTAPLAFLRMAFEQELGSGSEYSDANLAGQQIIYPFYAGAGSSDIDLGSGAMLPDYRPEIKGSNCIYSTGDADFADMIEDTIKSGQLQTNSQLGLIQRGVNCNEMPGAVQKSIWQTLEFYAPPVMVFNQPIAQGTILLAMSRARPTATPVTVSDTPGGQSWSSLYAGDTVGVFYAQASTNLGAGDVVSFLYNGAGQYNDDAYLLAMDPASDSIETSASTNGDHGLTPAAVSVSVTTAGPSYLVAFFNCNSNASGAPAPPVHWNDLFPDIYPNSVGARFTFSRVYYRIVTGAGTYTLTLPDIASTYDLVVVAISQSQASAWPKTLGNIVDHDTMQDLRDQCRANGLYGSIVMNAQRKAADWLAEFYMAANGAPVWSGFRLKSIPRSEVSTADNGAVYTAPTASGPVATLTPSDLIGQPGAPLIIVERTAQVDANNIMQIEHVNRLNDYNFSHVSEPESGGIAMFGPRKEQPISLHEIQDPVIARKILRIEVRRKSFLRNLYKFTMMAKWVALEAMDLILINDPLLDIVDLPVRLTSIKENNDYELECEAEPFYYGLNAPNDLEVSSAAPNNTDSSYVPALVNAPVIFEPVPRLSQNQNERQLWLGVSDSDPLYGGSVVYLSTDGGVSYVVVGTITGNAVTGQTTGVWAAGTSPDTANNLPLDLTESLGDLDSYAVADEDNFVYPCYLEHGTTDIPYELMSYGVAVLTGTNLYTLLATGTGNHLNRAVFGAPNAGNVGVSHVSGSRFLFLNPDGTGLLKLVMDSQWIGVTLYFKFVAFNTQHGGYQDLADVTAYPYTPAGAVGIVNPAGVPPQVFLVN